MSHAQDTMCTCMHLCAGQCILIMPLVLSHTNSQGVGAGINMQPAYLLSAAHLEPVFM